MNPYLQYVIQYVATTFAMSFDNICWIPDGKEYGSIRKNFFTFTIPWFNKKWYEFAIPKNKEGFKYTWNNRILEVIKHPRDILPALVSSAIIVLFINSIY